MVFKISLFAVSLFLLPISGWSQTSVKDYISQGVEHHDNQEYEKAIESYKKALELDSVSFYANYELAYSYFQLSKYDETIKYCDKAIAIDEKHVSPYVIKGSVLDILGRTDESIVLFEKAINNTEGHYLLNYNLGLNYYNLGEFDKAERQVVSAIEKNIGHSSSHLMLANIKMHQGDRIPSLLAAYYFLLIEPDSGRSLDIYNLIKEEYGSNVQRDTSDSKDVRIELSMDEDEFNAAELMTSLQSAMNLSVENEGKEEIAVFIDNTSSLFSQLMPVIEAENKEIWTVFYAPFFYDLYGSEHIETFCYYVSQNCIDGSNEWLELNEEKLSSFDSWLRE